MRFFKGDGGDQGVAAFEAQDNKRGRSKIDKTLDASLRTDGMLERAPNQRCPGGCGMREAFCECKKKKKKNK